MRQPRWKTIWQFLKTLKIELPYDPAILLLYITHIEWKAGTRTGICTPRFIATGFTIAKRWEPPKCPSTNEGMCKIWPLYTMESYSALKRKEMLTQSIAQVSLMDTMLSERAQSPMTPLR